MGVERAERKGKRMAHKKAASASFAAAASAVVEVVYLHKLFFLP